MVRHPHSTCLTSQRHFSEPKSFRRFFGNDARHRHRSADGGAARHQITNVETIPEAPAGVDIQSEDAPSFNSLCDGDRVGGDALADGQHRFLCQHDRGRCDWHRAFPPCHARYRGVAGEPDRDRHVHCGFVVWCRKARAKAGPNHHASADQRNHRIGGTSRRSRHLRHQHHQGLPSRWLGPGKLVHRVPALSRWRSRQFFRLRAQRLCANRRRERCGGRSDARRHRALVAGGCVARTISAAGFAHARLVIRIDHGRDGDTDPLQC